MHFGNHVDCTLRVEKFRQKGDKQAEVPWCPLCLCIYRHKSSDYPAGFCARPWEAQALDLLAGVYLASNEKDEASIPASLPLPWQILETS